MQGRNQADTVRSMKHIRALLLVITVAGLSTDTHAYTVRMHQELTRRSLPDTAFLLTGDGLVQPATPGQRAAFRTWLYTRAINHPDTAVAERFRARYPTAKAFSAMALREFLIFNMNPDRRIHSIDRSHSAPMSPRELLAISSADPDLDLRNQARFAYDVTAGAFVLDINGNQIPHDPATLNMGRSDGLSSQAHAHYGLPNYSFTDDPAVLKEAPERFLIKTGFPDGPVLALAADMAQMHTDLAVLAWLWGKPGSRYLALSFAGQSFHFLEDVGNQIHTVQVGAYDFFLAAKIQYWWRALITAGGYLGDLRPFTSIGIDILTNHHALIEELTALRFLESLDGKPTVPVVYESVHNLASDDVAYASGLEESLQAEEDDTQFARVLTQHLIETSATEGPKVYQHMEAIGCGRLSVEGFKVPKDGDDWSIPADDLVCHADDEEGRAQEHELYALQAVAFGRVSTSLRRYDRQMAALLGSGKVAETTNQIMGRFLTERLDMLDAAERRREQYVASIEPASGGPSAPYRDGAWLYGELAFLLALIGLALFRRRRAENGPTEDGQDTTRSPNICGESS